MRSYEATFSGDLRACPSLPERAAVVGLPSGAPATASCRDGPVSGVGAVVLGTSAAAGAVAVAAAEQPVVSRDMEARVANRACLTDSLGTWESSERVVGGTRNRKELANTDE